MAAGPVLPAPIARLVAFVALGAFGAAHWARLVEPVATGRLYGVLAVALVGGALLAVASHRRAGVVARAATTGAVALAMAAVVLVAAGVPGALLDPRAAGDLLAGLDEGLAALPGTRVPYAGVEDWTRIVIIAGGGLLIAAAALVAFVPRGAGRLGHPMTAAVVFCVLYGVPAVQRNQVDHPFETGLLFALLLALLLWLERVERRALPLAGLLVAAAGALALFAAPRLDGAGPLVDYERIADSLTTAPATSYDWAHSYDALDWPRDGREVLRIEAREPAYWKATHLTSFDGRRWTVDPRARAAGVDPSLTAINPQWLRNVRVTVRALSSSQFVGAGTTLRIAGSPRTPVVTGPGIFETARRPLRRGNSYRALVYVPDPGARELRDAGTDYPESLRADATTMQLVAPAAGSRSGPDQAQRLAGAERTVVFGFFGEAREGVAFDPLSATEPASAALTGSDYAGVYALARRLRGGAETPYAYVRAVERHLASGFSYSETPPPSSAPLADFLLRDRVGYCQQFSGAMALLLRMGGVPARVAAGFAPGSRDGLRREHVVRDIDAHSWVEVFFPGIGWVTRDPTPAASPARAQAADTAAVSDAPSDATLGAGGEQAPAAPPGAAGAPSPQASEPGSGGSESGIGGVAAAAALLLVVAGGAALLSRRRHRGADFPAEDASLAELRRALTRTGRPLAHDTTLQSLVLRFAGTPAEGYVTAVRDARFGGGGGAARGPSREQRAGLRRALAAHAGRLGRLRAWWAVPPRA